MEIYDATFLPVMMRAGLPAETMTGIMTVIKGKSSN
jgi:hypothetical protein